MDPRWLSIELVLAIHARQIAEHGGLDGIRDRGMLESALGRPENAFAYRGELDSAGLSAAYAFGIARNHPFSDGNKRTAMIACELFLNLNGWELAATDADLYPVIVQLAAGEYSEGALAAWLRERVHPRAVNEPIPRRGTSV